MIAIDGVSPAGIAAVGATTTTESGGDNASDLYSSDFVLGPGGVWVQTDGTASSTSGGTTHSSFTGNGGYGYSYVGGGMSGTWNEHGGSDANFTAQSSSTYDPNTYMWVTTGDWSGGGDDNQSSGYNGSGPYDASAGDPPSAGTTVITDGGTITESGSDTSSDNYNSSFALGANGVWTAVNGSDTSNGGGSTHSSYTGSGDVNSPQPGGGSVNSVWQITESGGTHYSMNTVSALNPDGTWATTGTGDYGGDDALNYDYSDQGYSASLGNILDGGAGQASDHYDITFALTANAGWQATGGSAYAGRTKGTHLILLNTPSGRGCPPAKRWRNGADGV
jgi:hypothetical protein